jgi:hypothetical protein
MANHRVRQNVRLLRRSVRIDPDSEPSGAKGDMQVMSDAIVDERNWRARNQ